MIGDRLHPLIREHELDVAARVHGSFLPHPVRHPHIIIETRYLPANRIGGDYCQVLFPDDDHCCVTISDVTGHGVASALMASRVSSEVRYLVMQGKAPHEVVRDINGFVCRYFKESGLYLTLFITRLNLPERRLTYSGAGHPPQMLIHRNAAEPLFLGSQNMLIGVTEDGVWESSETSVKLDPGDRLLLYTDGLSETWDQKEMLGIEGLARLAIRNRDREVADMADHIMIGVDEFRSGRAEDDMTMVLAMLTD
jgi:phosphoserine phosphatase RsbU/P